jgi:hypothetical protein
LPSLSSHTRLPSGGPPKASPLNITELLSFILGYVCDLSPATLAGALQVSKFWFDVGTGPLWNALRFDDCHVVFDYATMVKEKKKAGLAWVEVSVSSTNAGFLDVRKANVVHDNGRRTLP